MTPSSQDYIQHQSIKHDANNGERVVISGMSGLFPKSRNVKELSEILYNKIDPISNEDCRWQYQHPELTQYSGKAPGVDLFDAQFFGTHYFLADTMDANARKVLEQTYQAIYDAGINPAHLNNKNIGVYVGLSFSEAERTHFYELKTQTGVGLVGCSKTMIANRISYWLNLKGHSFAIDQACCSASAALEQGYKAIKSGDCEAAIVLGTSMCFLPQTIIHYKRIIDITKDGKTKSYSENADGCVNSDAVNVVFLQKAKHALRIYAEVVHVKTEFTGIIEGDTCPIYNFDRISGVMAEFIDRFYKEAQIPPQAVEYVEGLGSANPAADKTELQSIEEVYLQNRTDPLFVGSITSNIGFTQSATGLCGVIKVLLGYHTGELAGNLHCPKPRKDVAGLHEGRMRIVTERSKFYRTYTAINGMSVTGVNTHVLLHGNYKPKDFTKYLTSIPRLVNLSGRRESAVNKIIEDLKSRPIDPEELALLHNIHSSNIVGNMSRGYVILDVKDQQTVSLSEKVEHFDDVRPPLWLVYSGMGSQWPGMGTQLMRIPIFANAIERCQRVLGTKGLDLVNIITTSDESIFHNILHSFVGIAAIQIGLTDVLYELGLKPDGIIGHSVGELGCAYADGCLTAEEMILASYYRGLVSLETPFIRGSMAAVGLGYQEILNLLPPAIVVACHNGPKSCTISGPADEVNKFVAELSAQRIFAKEVACSNIAFHSKYIAEGGPKLLKYLNGVIKNEKPRSNRWVSTSVPQNKWNEAAAKINSAVYHTNNLLSPVLFEETSQLIPRNAVVVEVAPHGLLQAILKRSLSADCRHVPLTKRGHRDNAVHLLEAIGMLYMQGYNPRIEALYPKVQFPVSTETPMLSHLVEWIHDTKWNVPVYVGTEKRRTPSCNFVISIHDNEHSYLQGHIVRGKTVYPFAGALVAVWETLAMHTYSTKQYMSVKFHDVHLYVQPTLYKHRPLRLSAAINRCNGWFEVMDENSIVATGYIFVADSFLDQSKLDADSKFKDDDNYLKKDDIYQLLYEREYQYNGDFRSIEYANEFLNKAVLVWRNNWVTLIDGIMQLNMLRQTHSAVTLPTHIRRIEIDVEKHLKALTSDNKSQKLTANVSEIDDLTECGGVTIQDITYRKLPAVSKHNLELKVLAKKDNQIRVGSKQGNMFKEDNLSLCITKAGDLTSLGWITVPTHETPVTEVTVHYTGINMMDAKRASGAVTWPDSNNSFGMDFSGINKSGERVMGIVKDGAASMKVYAQSDFLWPVPTHWSLEDAATVPLAYLQAFYCFGIKSRLHRGMSVLIHGGAGALGQAAIAIALALNCKVFATVNNFKKKLFLQNLFPQLKGFIGNSRNESFVDMVLSNTNGLGCDIILCCVPSTLKNHTLRCAKIYGITIDVTQITNRDDYYFGMFNLEFDRTYIMADISSIFADINSEERKAMMTEGIARGYVRPLSRVVYTVDQVTSAFQLLTASQHRGRVLLRMQTDDKPQTIHRVSCSQEFCHLLICDAQPLGMQLAERLVRRGARKLYIICETLTAYQQYKISVLKKLHATVKVFTIQFEKQYTVSNVWKKIMNMDDFIEGIYVVLTKVTTYALSMVMTDLEQNLHRKGKSMCPSIKYVAVINSNETKNYQTSINLVPSCLVSILLDSAPSEDVYFCEIIDAIEYALSSGDSVHLTRRTSVQQPLLFHEIEDIIGIKLLTQGKVSLQELGVTTDKILLVLILLRDSYNILLEEKEISSLTVDRIKELSEIELDIIKPIKGLATFFSSVNYDEQLAMADLVFMPTLAMDLIMDNEFDVTQSYLSIVPGLEGHHERFSTLCERLKLPALVLQPGFDHLQETVPEMAQRYVKVLIKRTEFKNGEFNLLGYESGVLVALEMAALLEDQGLTGTVFCVGHLPDEFQRVLNEQLSVYKGEKQLQDSLVSHLYTLLGGDDITSLKDRLQNAATWSQKVDVCVRSLLGRLPYTAQYLRALMMTMLRRIKQVQDYKVTTHPLRSRLVLLRAATTEPPPQNAALEQYSLQPIVVHQLDTPLSNVLHDMRVTLLIHKYLSPHILENFDKINLCVTHSINNDFVVAKKLK